MTRTHRRQVARVPLHVRRPTLKQARTTCEPRAALGAYIWEMLGRNLRAKILPSEPALLEVAEIFYSIQGEGPFAGMPAVFIRLAGCPLQCKWCDTDFETVRERLTPEDLAQRAHLLRRSSGRAALCVLTGGEPLRQHVAPLVQALNRHLFAVQVETAGVHWREDLGGLFEPRRADGFVDPAKNTVVVSPKTPRLAAGIAPYVHALKYILQSGRNCIKDGLPVTDPQKDQQNQKGEYRLVRPDALGQPPLHLSQVYVQPCDEGNVLQNATNLNKAAQVAQRYGYRTSIQLHKLMKLS